MARPPLLRLASWANSVELPPAPIYPRVGAQGQDQPRLEDGDRGLDLTLDDPNDLRAQSAFTAGAEPPTEFRTTVDNQTVRIKIENPPAPDVVPDVVPTDPTLTPGQVAQIIISLVNEGNGTARRLRVCSRLSAKLELSGERCRRIARLRPGHTVIVRVRARVRRAACRGRLAHRIQLRVAGQPPRVRRAVARLIARRCPPPAVTG